jgi:predicted porin
MKKTLVAIAALAVVGAASAQSSVTLYGRIDASIGSTRTTNNLAGYSSNTLAQGAKVDPGVQVRSGGHTGSRWGMKGTEDLGGGLKANFQLEQGFNVDNGEASSTKQFHRQAWVGLSGGFGSLQVGRQYDPIDNMYGAHDPFGYSGYGAMNYVFNSNCKVGNGGASLPAGQQGPGDCIGRQDNSVFYTTPDMGGFSAGLMWAPGENKTTGVSAGNMYGLQAAYANGPLNVGGAWQSNKLNGNATAVKNWEIGGSYDLAVAKLFLQFEGSKVGGAVDAKDTGFQIGAVIPLGAPSLMVSYARENQKAGGNKYATATGLSLMAQYPLSKRTYVYAAYLNGQVDPTAAGVATMKQRNYGLGLVHNF